MDSNNVSLITNEYDDGVVCFGPVTESQLNRYNRLPRRTVLPSDFELSQSLFEQDEDEKNDKSTVLDVSNKNTTTCEEDNSINITQSTNNFDKDKEEIGKIELKQSISEDTNLRFSSPCSSKCIPNAKLIDTEVINRYIRMGSISSNETVSFTDPQEMQNNYDYDETNSSEHLSVSSIIEQSTSIRQLNVLDDSSNVCTLIHCSQKDDTDLSIYSDLELGDVSEDSIVTDEYSITPGKQRLFDLRVTKQSLRAKTLIASAPFMDRIEETTTPILPKVINSPFILNDISNRHLETKEKFNESSITEICHGTSTENLNQTSNENVFEINKLIDENNGESLISNDLKDTVSMNKSAGMVFDEITNRSIDSNQSLNETVHIQSGLNDTEHKFDNEKSVYNMSNIAIPTSVNDNNDSKNSISTEVDINSINTSVVDKIIDGTIYANKLSTNNQGMDLNKTDHTGSILNVTEHEFDDEKSINIVINLDNPTSDANNYNDDCSVSMEVDIKSSNTSAADTTIDETMFTSKILANNQSTNLNYSLNDTEQEFDNEKSICIISNVTIAQTTPTSGVSDSFDEVKSINTSVEDKVFDATIYANKLSTNNQSMDLNKSINKTDCTDNTLNVSEHKLDDEKSMNTVTELINPTSDANNYNDQEYSVPMEVDIKSFNTSVADTTIDETMHTSKLSTNNQSINLNYSLNDTKQEFDNEKSICIMSNVTIAQTTPTSGVSDSFDEVKSINTSVEDKVFDATIYANKLSTNNQSMDLNKSINKTDCTDNTLNVSEHKLDDEKSMNTVTELINPTSDANNYNDQEYSVPMEVDIKSFNTSVADTTIDETMHTSKLSTNNQSINLNYSLNDTKQEFDNEKSICVMSNIIIAQAIPTSGVNDHYDKEKSINITVTDKRFDKTMYTNRLQPNNKSMILNKSLNVTEHKFDDENSMNTVIDLANPTSDANNYNDEEYSVPIEVDIKLSNTSVTDTIIDETMYTSKHPTHNQSMDLNKSLNKTDYTENTLNVSEHKFDDEKSMNIVTDLANTTTDVNNYNDEEYPVPMDVNIKSSNTSVVDEKMYTNKHQINNSSTNFKESFNDTKHRFINIIQNTSIPAIHLEDKLHLSKLDKSILKNTIVSDSSLLENNEVNITCNTTLEDPSCMMRQYLDFEQTVNEICEDITSAKCPNRILNKPKASYDDETLERLIEQTLSSDTLNSTNVNANVSNYDGSNLSVIIENTTLEMSSNNIEQNEDILNSNNDVPITLESESIVNVIKDNELLNTSTVVNIVESTVASKSEVDIVNETNIQITTKANASNLMKSTIVSSQLVENVNKIKNNENSIISDELSEMKFDTFNKMDDQITNITTKQLLVPESINEKMHSNQINSTNFAAFKLISETEKNDENFIDQDDKDNTLNNDNQQQNLLDITKSINNSLEEFTNLEQMFNFGDNQKEKQVEYKTPKTQKLLDFSIIQQTPTFDNQEKKQKLLNFSIVDQTPFKSAQQTYPNENVINNDSLINFSSVDQIWNSEIVSKDEISCKDFQNSSSNNLSTILSPDVELLTDESIKMNTSHFSNLSFNQTITDSNVNLSINSCASNKTQNNITKLNNVELLVSVDRQIVVDKLSNSLNQTTKQDESNQKHDEHCVAEKSTKEVKLLSNITSDKINDSAQVAGNSNQELCINSNKPAIVDFSIIDPRQLEDVDVKNNTDVISVDSDRNLSNLIEMSLVSIPVTKSDEQPIILLENPVVAIGSDNRSKNSIDNSSDEINSTTVQFEESAFLHNNTELLTDIQMSDESLLTETPEKSSIIDSFHSIELDHVQEDNKRKIDTTQEYDISEKKMKVETETLKTPMSMLYKIKNMFRSSEKQPSCANNTKENNIKTGKCYQQLNFGKFEENNDNFTKPTPLKKSEVLTKSKIPCKVTDKSSKNDEFNNSSISSLNDSIKQKKTIPKFSGVPVLSDVSNSTNRKCAESRIPSKFQK
ncbi:MATH and LRR domain-containing protein PFE0570w-like isoform X2 [Rhopalosiphum maidis]|uniref:MATH and LRR domain-containing protein PFE0570w-like isoform X2 n=1 Tax=Rhopalosiphum maidis TaxID=43146 RepID=UPI000F009EFF|nr:MATH and LRR domain-containing protein PFE0570w-like isoform X2 [Rhopalosiphum maidis]